MEHVQMLIDAAKEIAREGHAGWGNLCADAAAEITTLRARIAELEKTAKSLVDGIIRQAICIAELESRQVPEGWQAVPKEPTPEMIAAWPSHCHGAGHEEAIYKAMLAAAPSPADSGEVKP